MDDSFSGTIYRIAPPNFTPVIPPVDLAAIEGQITALRSPAVNVRYLGFRALRDAGARAFPAVAALLQDKNKWVAARAVWLLPYLGERGLERCLALLGDERSQQRVLAYRALRRAGHDMIPHARRMASDPSPQVRREVALSLRDLPAAKTADIFVELARRCDTTDKNSLEAIGLGAANQESAIWIALHKALQPGPPSEWPESFARLTWRLWGAASLDHLKARALDLSLTLDQRKFAVESIAFIDDARAARVMLELASEGSPVKGEATAWLLRNAAGEWARYDLHKGLKERGIYDPESVVISAAPVPAPPDRAPAVEEILKLKGDPSHGRTAAARCILCHQVDGNGNDYGPNLRGWARTQEREVIIRAIANPSAEIAHGYKGTEIVLKNGDLIHGIAFNNSDLSRDDSPPVVIQSVGGVTQLIPKDRIEDRRDFKRSLMYDPVTLGLKAQDIADLAAWLRTYR
jgi:putative heme-binding domain-containing protein